MEPIPVRIRERIIALYAEGESTAEIADLLGYCPAAVRRVRQHHRERGTLEPRRPAVGRKSTLTAPVADAVRAAVAAVPDATLAELRAAAGTAAAVSTVDRWLDRLGLTRKKSRPRPPSTTART
jgi:transposase